MKKTIIIVSILMFMFSIFGFTSKVCAAEQVLDNRTESKIIQMKEKSLNSLEDYKQKYGSEAYGVTAYVLSLVRIYSIPFGFVAIVIAGVYQYIIGIKKLDVRDKGFAMMMASVTLVVICQVLPLVFAIVVRGWRS